MFTLIEKFFDLLREGTYPVVLPLMTACLGIGVLTFNRILYLYDSRWWLGLVWPPMRREMRTCRAEISKLLSRFLDEPTQDHRRKLIEACRGYRTPYTRFLIDLLSTDLGGRSRRTLDLEIERNQVKHDLAIESGMQLLSTFAKAAPLMGLMGTVTGMIATFAAMMVASTSDPKALSAGISIALIATNIGLVVSLPGIVAMGLLSRRGMNQQEQIRLASMQFFRLREGAR